MIENKRFWKLNIVIRWVYKVVKEASKKSEKIHVVFFYVIVNTHEVVAKSKRVMYKRLSIIREITHIQHRFWIKSGRGNRGCAGVQCG